MTPLSRFLLTAALLWPLAGAAQTRIVLDVAPGAETPLVREGVVVAGTYYFPGGDLTEGTELWAYDLTTGEGRLFLDLAPGPASGVDGVLGEHAGWLYIAGSDGATGVEPWRVRLSTGEAEPLADIAPGVDGSFPRLFAVATAEGFEAVPRVYFAAQNASGEVLWEYTPPESPDDGGGAAPGSLAPVRSGSQPLRNPTALRLCDDCTEQPGSLWILADIGATGNTAVYVIPMDPSSGQGETTYRYGASGRWLEILPDLGPDGEEGVVLADDSEVKGRSYGNEPVLQTRGFSRPAAKGSAPLRVYDIRPGGDGSNPGPPARIGNYLYLAADDGARGRELWRIDLRATDPVASGELVADIRPGPKGSNPFDLQVADRLYFLANDGASGQELWAHDPRTGVTEQVADIGPGAAGGQVRGLVPAGDVLLFSAESGADGRELWAHGTCGGSGTAEATAFRACAGLPSENADAVAVGTVAGREEVWAATASGLARYAAGAWETISGPYRPPLTIGNGRVYAASARGLAVFDGSDWTEAPFDGVFQGGAVLAIEAASGGVWIAEDERPNGDGYATVYHSASPDGGAWRAVTETASENVTIVQSSEGLAWVSSFDPDDWVVPGGDASFGRGAVRKLRGFAGLGWGESTAYTQPTEGLCLEQTADLAVLPSGTVWAAYDEGWCREAHGKRAVRGGRRGRKMARYDGSTWTSRPVGGGRGRRPAGGGADDEITAFTSVAADARSETVWVGGAGLAYALDPGGEAWRVLGAADLGVPDLRVRDLAVDASGAVWAATPRGVLRYAPALAAPDLLSPEAGARQAPTTPRLRWAVVPGAEAYDVQLALDPSFGAPLLSETVTGLPTLALAAALDPAVRYHWRVRARRGGAGSPWSEPLAFVTGGRAWDAYTALETAVPGGAPIAVGTDASGRVWTLWESVLSAVAVFDGSEWTWDELVPTAASLHVTDDGLALATTLGNGGFDSARDGGFLLYERDGEGGLRLLDEGPIGCYGDEFDACFGALWAGQGGGRIWAGGVAYFQDATGQIEQTEDTMPVQAWTVYDGLAAPDGSLWLASRNSVADVAVTHFDPAESSGDEWALYGPADGVPEGSAPRFFDAAGTLWAAGPGGLASFDGSLWRTAPLPGRQEVWALARDGDALWAATADGLARGQAPYASGDWTLAPYDSAGPHPADPVAVLAIDAQGNAWIAGDAETETGASVLTGGRWTRYTRADGALPSDAVTDLAAGSDGSVWIATRGGMARTTASGVVVSADPAPEAAPALGLPRPNPARGAVTVPYRVGAAGEATVEVFDMLGRRVAVLASGAHPAGEHFATLDARGLAAGAYAVRLTAGDRVEVRRLTFVR